MSIHFNRSIFSILAAGFLASCATNPAPLPPNNPADPQVRGSFRTPRNVLAPDETTLAIEKQLSATQAQAEGAEKIKHDMGNMPGMQHGKMQPDEKDQHDEDH
jgi:hypothetical protein